MTKAKALTEGQWLGSASPYVLLRHLQQHYLVARVPGGRRRLRLFCCACCRVVWDLFEDGRCRRAVEVAERFAEGQARKAELTAAWEDAQAFAREVQQRFQQVERRQPPWPPEAMRLVAQQGVASAAEWAASPRGGAQAALIGSMCAANAFALTRPGERNQVQVQAVEVGVQQSILLRDIFGNPFRPVLWDPSWLERNNRAALHLARTIHAERAFDQMPVLADALEEAGCADEQVLAHCHCRSGGEHVLGCWVLDRVLGRA
jgi:hypothetical protein